jgi:hypothetical protein
LDILDNGPELDSLLKEIEKELDIDKAGGLAEAMPTEYIGEEPESPIIVENQPEVFDIVVEPDMLPEHEGDFQDDTFDIANLMDF